MCLPYRDYKSYPRNCDILTEAHDMLISWANVSKIKFNQAKYNIMHFHAYDKGPKEGMDQLPRIPGLIEDADRQPEHRKQPKTELEILGLIVDNKLSWIPQVSSAIAKGRRKMGYLSRLFGPTWGTNLHQMRNLYVSKVRTTISYGCAAWLVPKFSKRKIQYTISKANLKKLEAFQNWCLSWISSAKVQTNQKVIRKELFIDSIKIYLRRLVLAQWARQVETAESDAMAKIRMKLPKSKRQLHPYHVLAEVGRDRFAQVCRVTGLEEASQPGTCPVEVWKSRKKSDKRLNRSVALSATQRSSKEWAEYVQEKRDSCRKHQPVVVQHGWGKDNLKWYKSLSRAQSTMLIHYRTEKIELNSYRHNLNRPGYEASCPFYHLTDSCD